MRIIDEILVKFKHIESCDDSGDYISANFYKGKASEILSILKQVDSIRLKDGYYVYNDSCFVPSEGIGIYDALYIYVSSYDD